MANNDDRTVRESRRLSYLEGAARLVLDRGFGGLTMGALASEVGAAIGTTYGYFESKDEILAELQLVSVDALLAAWDTGFALWSAALAPQAMDAVGSGIAGVLLFAEYLVAVPDAYPEEFRLQQMQLATADDHFEPKQLAALTAAAARMLAVPQDRVIALAAADRRFAGDPFARATQLAFGLNGIALIRNLGTASPLFDIAALSRSLVADILVGWGATRAEVASVSAPVRDVVATHPLTSLEVHRTRRLATLSSFA